ncbi:hypothetical protein FHX14_004806 [Rhizobium sp. BK619]|nr:hypothetical protein [Rhizobium sp. BK619]
MIRRCCRSAIRPGRRDRPSSHSLVLVRSLPILAARLAKTPTTLSVIPMDAEWMLCSRPSMTERGVDTRSFLCGVIPTPAASLAKTPTILSVIPGLEPGIHATVADGCGVDARLKAEHDGGWGGQEKPFTGRRPCRPSASETRGTPAAQSLTPAPEWHFLREKLGTHQCAFPFSSPCLP